VVCTCCAGTGYLPDAHPPQPCHACCGVGFAYCCEGAPARMAEFCDDHTASTDCWCGPYEDEDGVWIHREVQRHFICFRPSARG